MPLVRDSLVAVSTVVAAPVVVAALACRSDWRVGLPERLGGLPRQTPGALWLHGASVGEARLVARIAQARLRDGHRVIATVQTATARALLRAESPDLSTTLAPVDHPWSVGRALDRVAPAAIVLFETEIWPCWISAAAERDIPIGILSGRISDRSWPRYRRIAPLIRGALGRLSAIGARGPDDAARFLALGADPARVRVTGDLKYAAASVAVEPPVELRRALAGECVFVAASTHAGEEQAVLDACEICERSGLPVRLVLAPRHLARIDEVEQLVVASGRRCRRRSRLGDAGLAPGEVLLLDTLGELRGLHALARIVFVGGSLVALGGHDPIEVVQQGCPVAIGPSHANVREPVERLVAAGAAVVVADAEALARAVQAAVQGSGAEARRAAEGFVAEGREVFERSLAWIDRLVGRDAR